MKQIIQDLKTGSTILGEVPTPQVKPGYVLIMTSRSLVSPGTERMWDVSGMRILSLKIYEGIRVTSYEGIRVTS